MSKVIQVLEKIGQMADADIAQILLDNKLNAALSEAVINKNVVSLERQLDICPEIVCFLLPAKDEDEEESNTEEEQSEAQSVVNE
ncbi:hypothetical protein ESZ36_18800 [Colwellia demingiae]|uniref:Uncharacterized protein n=1 Tax=Colwellia demingiae TaxID=89401 RepID=A0A5C6Q803_9GAMM|nr:hypothetical protein [Colwellia demingiae]TWX64750.1 hypothetical protein ESZ36_18800 [Colwellia demingiae]